jgi:hypothetical protein
MPTWDEAHRLAPDDSPIASPKRSGMTAQSAQQVFGRKRAPVIASVRSRTSALSCPMSDGLGGDPDRAPRTIAFDELGASASGLAGDRVRVKALAQ